MYLFYFDESGSRDPDVGGNGRPEKDHIYVLLAVGIFENNWRKFDREISLLKLELEGWLRREGKGPFDLADCEVKSNWLRNVKERTNKSPFLSGLTDDDRTRLANKFYEQLGPKPKKVIVG
ncbi:MAG: hypothetical protein WDN01_07390 [Rhizomicrobium sp.]